MPPLPQLRCLSYSPNFLFITTTTLQQPIQNTMCGRTPPAEASTRRANNVQAQGTKDKARLKGRHCRRTSTGSSSASDLSAWDVPARWRAEWRSRSDDDEDDDDGMSEWDRPRRSAVRRGQGRVGKREGR